LGGLYLLCGCSELQKFHLQVNYINAHATSTIVGDLAEVNALKKVFKDTSDIKMNGTKVRALVVLSPFRFSYRVFFKTILLMGFMSMLVDMLGLTWYVKQDPIISN
jgi:hypothetical protein